MAFVFNKLLIIFTFSFFLLLLLLLFSLLFYNTSSLLLVADGDSIDQIVVRRMSVHCRLFSFFIFEFQTAYIPSVIYHRCNGYRVVLFRFIHLSTDFQVLWIRLAFFFIHFLFFSDHCHWSSLNICSLSLVCKYVLKKRNTSPLVGIRSFIWCLCVRTIRTYARGGGCS